MATSEVLYSYILLRNVRNAVFEGNPVYLLNLTRTASPRLPIPPIPCEKSGPKLNLRGEEKLKLPPRYCAAANLGYAAFVGNPENQTEPDTHGFSQRGHPTTAV